MLLGLLERPLSKENFAVPLLPVMTSSTNRVDVEVLSSDIYHSIKEILQRAHSLCTRCAKKGFLIFAQMIAGI